MTLHFNLNLYWLLLPLFVGLFWWATYERADERSTGFIPSFAPLFRMAGAAIVFVLVICGLLAFNLWLL